MIITSHLISLNLISKAPLFVHHPNSFVRLLHWPSAPNPTPYQIFGLEPNQPVIDRKKLRGIYFQLVKQYHPDSGSTGDADRFKKVVEAHNILRDESKRRSYDLSQFNAGSYAASPQYTRQGGGHSFEDDIDINYWSNRHQEKFDQGLYENRIWILKMVASVTITFAIINLLLMKKASEVRYEALNQETEKAAMQLAYSSSNYGYGGNAEQRIARFLDDRQRMLDRFDNEFRWTNLKTGGSRNPPSSVQPDPPAEQVSTDENSTVQETVTPKESSRGKPQMKHHTGPVASYFGRT